GSLARARVRHGADATRVVECLARVLAEGPIQPLDLAVFLRICSRYQAISCNLPGTFWSDHLATRPSESWPFSPTSAHLKGNPRVRSASPLGRRGSRNKHQGEPTMTKHFYSGTVILSLVAIGTLYCSAGSNGGGGKTAGGSGT